MNTAYLKALDTAKPEVEAGLPKPKSFLTCLTDITNLSLSLPFPKLIPEKVLYGSCLFS